MKNYDSCKDKRVSQYIRKKLLLNGIDAMLKSARFWVLLQ